MKYLVLCNILFTSFILCSDTTASKSKVTNNILHDSLPPNETQIPSEGGSISTDKLMLAFPETNSNILSLDNEAGKSKIHARKGAVNFTDDVTKSPEKSSQPTIQSTSLKPSAPAEKANNITEQPKTNTSTLNLQKVDSIYSNKSSDSISKPVQVPKKPLILNADLLEKSPPEIKSSTQVKPSEIKPSSETKPSPEIKPTPEVKPSLEVKPLPDIKPSSNVKPSLEIKSSPETLVYNQIQSPNKDVKSYLSSANNHPGMVMPIVITILLVPMFAVLGYMALRRGQEAWKNRHYKRMDFLLDGMYND